MWLILIFGQKADLSIGLHVIKLVTLLLLLLLLTIKFVLKTLIFYLFIYLQRMDIPPVMDFLFTTESFFLFLWVLAIIKKKV